MDQPVIAAQVEPSIDEEGARIQKMAAAMDAGEGVQPEIKPTPEVAPEPAPGEPKTGDPTPTPEVKPEAKAGERQRGPDGKFLPKAEAPKAEGTAYEKAKKEEDRQKNLLANFEQEKAAVRKQAAELAQRERQLQQAQAQNRPEATLHGYTAREYVEAIKVYKQNGDYENAYRAAEAVDQIRAFESQYFQQANQQSYEAAFNADMDKQLKADEQLRDQNSPLAQMVAKVLEQYPEVFYLQNGFSKTVEIAKRFMDADSTADFRTKLEAAEKEIKNLRAATQPGSGGPSAPSGPRKFSEMSSSEQEADLRRQVEQADQMAA